MIKIRLTSEWNDVLDLFEKKAILQRYEWFLFEFGKKASKLFYKHLLQQISDIPGTKHYKKSLMIAEIRDKGREAWWAIVSSAKPMGNAKYNPKTSSFTVISRFENVEQDPVKEILEAFGPWTVDTIPFVPSSRAGQVVLKEVSEEALDRIKDVNFDRGEKIRSLMAEYGIPFEPRQNVYDKLRVIEDIELTALRIEFGLAAKSKPHWRPSLRWLKRVGMRNLEKDKDLVRVWTDPTFMKYRLFRHFRIRLNRDDVKRMQKFQEKVRL